VLRFLGLWRYDCCVTIAPAWGVLLGGGGGGGCGLLYNHC